MSAGSDDGSMASTLRSTYDSHRRLATFRRVTTDPTTVTSGACGRVVGLDVAAALGWVAVVVDGHGFAAASVGTLDEVLARSEPVDVVGVDIPIGDSGGARRACDVAARRFVGPRASSVFAAPALETVAATYAATNEALAGAGRPKLSRQAWALLPRMREVAEVAASDQRLVEVHPEVSFRAMAGRHLAWPKTSWNGQAQRRRLLAAAGVELPDELGAVGKVPPADLLDAAAVAWSARRVARGEAATLPDPPERHRGRVVAIWY